MYVLAPNLTVEKFPYSVEELRRDNPQISFPQAPSAEVLAERDVFPVLSTSPQFDSAVQIAEPDGVTYNSERSRWETAWVVRNKTTQELFADAKFHRQALVDAITVTTQSGKVFDGNEEAQRRMTSAITAMDEGDQLPWVLHDNTVAVVGRIELREALRLAGAQMAAIWIAPYATP